MDGDPSIIEVNQVVKLFNIITLFLLMGGSFSIV